MVTSKPSNLDIDSVYPITEEQIAFFDENGFIKLKNVLSPKIIEHFGKEITEKVLELNTVHLPMEERSTYDKAFLQVTNLWQHSALTKRFVMGKRLGRIAAELMQVRGVRLYHDQGLYKEPGGGHTPWHADLYYWPLATDKACTAWIPLQETPLEQGPLAFSVRSHRFAYGRNLKISDESEEQLQQALAEANFEYENSAFELGDVSFHAGWTFHRAGPNTTDRPRRVMTIIYMDIDMRLKEPENDNQVVDRDVFCPGIGVGEIVDSPLNPVIYSVD